MTKGRTKATQHNTTSANLGFEVKLGKAADTLRGAIDAAEYKHVVLGLIFLKYISDAFEAHYEKLRAEPHADPEDPDEYRAANIFWVPPQARWSYLQKNARQPNVGQLVDETMATVERDNPSLKGVLPKDYARPDLEKQRLGQLIDLVTNIHLGGSDNHARDILGRVYEYFLGQFASAEGKKGGEFYTPRCVARLLVEMLQPYKGRVYDPCCGSSGMFVQSVEFIEAHATGNGNGGRARSQISIYGQELNYTTWRLAKMNLAIRGIDGRIEQGDSILIQSPDGKAALIDGGSAGSGAVQYLRQQGVQRLDLVVATHPHEDHIGGLVEVLQAIPVAEVVTNGQPTTTRVYERFLDAIAAAKAQYREVKRGQTLELGSLKLDVLHPVVPTGDDLNSQSIVLRMVYGQTTFLFMGDAGQEAEKSIMANLPRLVGATVLKVGHHCSRSASSVPFLKAVQPKVAVYSAGVGNGYGHPHPETIASLLAVGAEVYGTDINGTVVIVSDEAGYSISTSKANGPRAPPAVPSPAPSSGAVEPTTTAVQPAEPAPALSLDVLSVTSPVRPGTQATLKAKTTAGAECSIIVYYKSGPSSAKGLEPKVADAGGNVSWTWTVGTNTTPGTCRIVVKARQGGNEVSKEIPFEVAK